MNDKLLFLAKNYDLVEGDTFELFYRGVIRSMNPYQYYIYVTSPKGRPYPRYYTYTPAEGDEGDYPLTITLYDDFGRLIEQATTTLHVHKPVAPKRKINILCFGDSITYNGVWPYEGYRRFTKDDGEPKGLGFNDTLNFVGTMKKVDEDLNEVGYEGICKLCSGKIPGSDQLTQGIGYYSSGDKNQPILSEFNLDPSHRRATNQYGTDIYIIGFKIQSF